MIVYCNILYYVIVYYTIVYYRVFKFILVYEKVLRYHDLAFEAVASYGSSSTYKLRGDIETYNL